MTSKKMQAWRLHNFGLGNVQLNHIAVPVPGPGEMLIRVGAASLNFRDNAVIEGYYDPNILKNGPLTLLADAAGTIEAIGEGVTRFKTGDRVTTHYYSKWLDGIQNPDYVNHLFGGPLQGGLSEYMLVPDYAAVTTPAHLSDEEASTLPIAALTAWFALTSIGSVKKGDTVLIQGTGGVSIFAIQIAAALGATVIATSSSDEKGEKAKLLGAAHIINYARDIDWEQKVLELTGGQGVDQVLEVVGGKNLNKSIQAAKIEGLVTIIGFLDDEKAKISLLPLIIRQTRLQGMVVGHRKSFEEMMVFLEDKKSDP
jgi:NADPH:quinone reductase-like Zn-dependent oxidoreductase